MDDDPAFRVDLYRGTAAFYDEYRLPYPDDLVDDLLRRVSPRGDGRLLDLACGTGQVTFALCPPFREVWAVDQEPDAVELARTKAARDNVRNVRWIAQRAEDVDPGETFELVTVGNAFHRLERRRVAGLAMQWLRDGGHLALLWSDSWAGSAAWQHALAGVVHDWTQLAGAADRVPRNLDAHLTQHPHTAVLHDAGFGIVERYEFVHPHEWSVATLIGFMYSTSVLSRAVLGDRSAEFEADLRARLLAAEPSGVFRNEVSFAYDLAKPA